MHLGQHELCTKRISQIQIIEFSLSIWTCDAIVYTPRAYASEFAIQSYTISNTSKPYRLYHADSVWQNIWLLARNPLQRVVPAPKIRKFRPSAQKHTHTHILPRTKHNAMKKKSVSMNFVSSNRQRRTKTMGIIWGMSSILNADWPAKTKYSRLKPISIYAVHKCSESAICKNQIKKIKSNVLEDVLIRPHLKPTPTPVVYHSPQCYTNTECCSNL